MNSQSLLFYIIHSYTNELGNSPVMPVKNCFTINEYIIYNTYIIHNEQVILQCLSAFINLLRTHICPPDFKSLPFAKQWECWNLQQSFMVQILLLPTVQIQKVNLPTPGMSNSTLTDSVVVMLIDVFMGNNPKQKILTKNIVNQNIDHFFL